MTETTQMLSPVVAASAATGISPLAMLSNLSTSPLAIGATWLVSSAIFTTYSTTRFLKYGSIQDASREDLAKRMHKIKLPIQPANPFLSLPPANMLTLYRFAGSLILGLLLHPNFAVLDRLRATVQAVPAFALPAFFLFVANLANSYALDRIGISLTYTSKCGIPILTVLLTLLLDGPAALPRLPTLLSLLPIATGIAAASWSAPTLDGLGLAAAGLSATAQSALNVSSKRVMKTAASTMGPAAAQRTMVLVGLGLAGVWNVWQVVGGGMDNGSDTSGRSKVSRRNARTDVAMLRPVPPVGLTLLALASYHVEYVLSFTFVTLVQPVTYGTCDAVRRLAIILTGRAMFGGDPLTKTNRVGIGLALVGALLFSVTSALW